jgi:hypothetical protein
MLGALPGLVPNLRSLHIGVKHVANTSNCSIALAGLIVFGSPFLSALFAAFLANTPDPTHSVLSSTLSLQGQAYEFFLAFSVWSWRAGPSPLRSAGARRRGRGTYPRPAARAPSLPLQVAPRPAVPGRVSLYVLAGRAVEAPGPVPLFAPTPRTCWSRLDASRDSSAGGARTGPDGPVASPPAGVT